MIVKLCVKMVPFLGNMHYELGANWFALLIKNYVCDMLWAYALTISMIWYGQMFRQPIEKACVMSIVFSVFVECLQLFPFVAGTFDILDVCVEMGMVGLATWISLVFYKKEDRRGV